MEDSFSDLDTVTSLNDPNYWLSRHTERATSTSERKYYPTHSRSSQEDQPAERMDETSSNQQATSDIQAMLMQRDIEEKSRRSEDAIWTAAWEEKLEAEWVAREERCEAECEEERLHRRKTEEDQRIHWQKQIELENERVRLRALQEETQKHKESVRDIPKYSEKDELFTYLARFESVMKEASIGEAEWVSKLRNVLTGKALAIWEGLASGMKDASYEELKDDFF